MHPKERCLFKRKKDMYIVKKKFRKYRKIKNEVSLFINI